MPLGPGAKLGPYEVLAPLGAGGMGEVYRARDARLGRDIAIKVLPAEVARDAERLARFRREAHVLASLNHANIAAIHGLEESDGKPFLVLELVEGETLQERFARGPISVDEALPIALQIAEALEEAHEQGIVHRDLKPANIKLRPDGKVKVLDFGLAKAYSGDGDAEKSDLSHSPTLTRQGTEAGVILGTAAYMSPEQARGKRVDKRADIWAFGVVLFEMLTGRRLFAGDTVSDVLASVLKETPRWEELPVGLPGGVVELLERCLTKDPRDRLHDIADARIELQQLVRKGAAGAARSLSNRDREAPSGARIGPWGLLLAGIAIGATALWLRPRPTSNARVRFVLTPPGGAGARVLNLRLSRDGRRLVYKLSSERRLLLHNLEEFESRPLAGTEDAVLPFVSPDGRWVGFFQAGKMRKIAFDGGDPTDICDAPQNTPGAAWGKGDAILFSPAWVNVGLWRVNARGGRPVELTKPDHGRGETGHFWPDVLPDGGVALFTIFGGRGLADSKVGLLDLESKQYVVLFEGAAASYVESGHILYYRGGVYRAVPFDAARRRVTGPETTVLPEVRRFNPVGSPENYAAFAGTGVLAYVKGDSTVGEPLSRLAWASSQRRLEELPFEGYHGTLSLSPDGTRVAVDRIERGQQQIYVYDLARGTTEQLTHEGQNFNPTWHPDGRRVAFASVLTGTFDLNWASVDGTSGPESLVATNVDEGFWSWAPDGESGVFQSWSAVSGADLWRAKGDGSEPTPLVASPLSDERAAFSPDGKWLAYRSGDSLYVAGYPSLAQRVVIAPFAESPHWSRVTPELFYLAENRLKAVTYDLRAGIFRPAAATTLFELGRLGGRSFDVAPDGQRFLFFAEPQSQPDRDVIRVVLNGFEELRGGSPVLQPE